MKRKALRAAFPCTIPVMMGYLFLGIAFGVLLVQKNISPIWAFVMSAFIYAGSMQFVTLELLSSAFSPLSALIMTFMVNARHIFYGFSMLEKFKKLGRFRPYMIFSLTDETYSLLCGIEPPENVDRKWFCFFLSALDHLYWITGSCIGAVAGNLISFDSTGIDFAMTALFLVIFTEQWESSKNHLPALLGLGITLMCRIVFGADHFLLYAMAGIFACLLLFKKQCTNIQKEEL